MRLLGSIEHTNRPMFLNDPLKDQWPMVWKQKHLREETVERWVCVCLFVFEFFFIKKMGGKEAKKTW